MVSGVREHRRGKAGQTVQDFSVGQRSPTFGWLRGCGDCGGGWAGWMGVRPAPVVAGLVGAGRSARSSPSSCMSFNLMESTFRKTKLFGKKIKQDSLTN